ncbi:reverse transcriptase [Tanacetum coccineum]
MGFIKGLPLSNGKSVILVVVDRLSRYSHFIALSHPYTAVQVANAFMDHVYKLHGLPQIIVSDRGKVFLSLFWKEFLETTTKAQLLTYIQGQSLVDKVDKSLSAREDMVQLLKFHLQRAQQKIKVQADKGRTDRILDKVGQVAYKLLLPSTSQIHPVFHVSQLKLYKAVYVLIQWSNGSEADATWELHSDKVGQVAYKSLLPFTSQIHPVFHVSQFKLYKGPLPNVTAILPVCDAQGELLQQPVKVLDRRLGKVGNSAAVYVLIQWSNGSEADVTWELHSDMVKPFPAFPINY